MEKWKEQKGVTLSSLMVYVIAMLIITATVATVTSFFYQNVNNLSENAENIAKMNQFNMYFLEEVKKTDNTVLKISSDQREILFSSGNTYTFQDNAIYQNAIRICDWIQEANFKVRQENQRMIIQVYMVMGTNMEYAKTTDFVLESKLINSKSGPEQL